MIKIKKCREPRVKSPTTKTHKEGGKDKHKFMSSDNNIKLFKMSNSIEMEECKSDNDVELKKEPRKRSSKLGSNILNKSICQ